MKKVILFLTIITMPLMAQRIVDNPWLKYDVSETKYEFHVSDSVYIKYGLELWFSGQNNAVLPEDLYDDSGYWGFSPRFDIYIEDFLRIELRGRGQSARNELLDSNRSYTGYKDFRGLQGDVEISDIQYQGKYLRAALGKNYLSISKLKTPHLLFSRDIRPVERLMWGIGTDWVDIEAGLLFLDNMKIGANPSQRYLNYHRLLIGNPFKAYVAVSEALVYGGPHRQPDYLLLNPFNLYHFYSLNTNLGSGFNTLGTLEWGFYMNGFFTEGQFLIDDFQVDNEVPGDLEPNELGISLTGGWKESENPVSVWTNFTMIRNRTYNAPVFDEEKYLYKNLPLGHWWGNNFWSVQLTGEYQHKKISADLTWMYREYGDEALYGEFNKDFLNYTVEEGYDEPFPFGAIHKQHGIYGNAAYLFKNWLLINGSVSYWFHPGEMPDNFGVRLGLGLRF